MGRDDMIRARTPVMGRHDPLPEGDAKHEAVEAMFNRVAPGYERMNRIISLGLDRRWRRRAIQALELAPGARVLDLACGTGDLCRDLASAGCPAVGVDFSAGMLDAAHVRSPLVRGDAASLPFGEHAFDGVVCGFALRNFVDLDVVFRECARVVRRGGRFVALDAAVPEHLVMRLGNAVWFRGAVPVLGRLLSRDPSAYRYLPRSTAYLPDGPELIASLERAGFATVTRALLTGGSVQLLAGTRS
jgi:demethylmenaquinone methyltransferase/2-methoxy-6-polyprenyl-1,4-benzoquinol methylase